VHKNANSLDAICFQLNSKNRSISQTNSDLKLTFPCRLH